MVMPARAADAKLVTDVLQRWAVGHSSAAAPPVLSEWRRPGFGVCSSLGINSGSWAGSPWPDPLGRRLCASCSGLLHVPVSHVLLFLVDVDLAIDSF